MGVLSLGWRFRARCVTGPRPTRRAGTSSRSPGHRDKCLCLSYGGSPSVAQGSNRRKAPAALGTARYICATVAVRIPKGNTRRRARWQACGSYCSR
jgi:hypothetical protein